MKSLFTVLFCLFACLASGQINNNGFEMWDSTFVNSYSANLATLYNVPNPCGGILPNWTFGSGFGVSRTTDSHSGNYSIIIHNWYGYAYESLLYHDSISYMPQYFQGYYKYIAEDLISGLEGTVEITLTRFNGSSTDTIARGTFIFNSTPYYIPFESTMNYFSALAPDSVSIFFINAFRPCDSTSVCNLLYLDELTLSDTPLSSGEIASDEPEISVFPNPSADELKIITNSAEQLQISLYNSIGDIMLEKILPGKMNSMDLSSLPNGIYFYSLSSDGKNIQSGKFIKQ
jgi:hypothetical protein